MVAGAAAPFSHPLKAQDLRRYAMATFDADVRAAVVRKELRPLTAEVLLHIFRHLQEGAQSPNRPSHRLPGKVLAAMATIHMASRARQRGGAAAMPTQLHLAGLERGLFSEVPLDVSGSPQEMAEFLLGEG